MLYYKPDYYDEFRCVAGACPDTCCAGWQIMIDEASLTKYAAAEGSFGSRLRNSINWLEECFEQCDGACAFLNEEKLCDIYSALGSEALCDTCRQYPRHVEEYEGVREWSLSLSCPIAAKIILSRRGRVSLLETETSEEEGPEEFEDFDGMLYTQLVDARRVCFDKLWQKEVTSQSFMENALFFARELQACVDAAAYYRLEEVIAEFEERDWTTQGRERTLERAALVYEEIYRLERLRPQWEQTLLDLKTVLYDKSEAFYKELRQEAVGDELEGTTKQLLFFFVYTYFCGAVYDDWIYSKMALSVESVQFIQDLWIAGCLANGRKITEKEMEEAAYRYAREIEHSDDNLNALEEFFNGDIC